MGESCEMPQFSVRSPQPRRIFSTLGIFSKKDYFHYRAFYSSLKRGNIVVYVYFPLVCRDFEFYKFSLFLTSCECGFRTVVYESFENPRRSFLCMLLYCGENLRILKNVEDWSVFEWNDLLKSLPISMLPKYCTGDWSFWAALKKCRCWPRSVCIWMIRRFGLFGYLIIMFPTVKYSHNYIRGSGGEAFGKNLKKKMGC